jgi:hypothetical protein
MPTFAGSFSGKVQSETTVSVADQAAHALRITTVSGRSESPDERWNDLSSAMWTMADTVGGTGVQRGYLVHERTNGDRVTATFEGRIATSARAITVEGTYKLSGGTGAFAMVRGEGTYSVHRTSQTDVAMTWNGDYDLGRPK